MHTEDIEVHMKSTHTDHNLLLHGGHLLNELRVIRTLLIQTETVQTKIEGKEDNTKYVLIIHAGLLKPVLSLAALTATVYK